jgi:hypothetical protein
MNRRAVVYKGTYLDPNSKAYELYHDKNRRKELDAHMKKLDQKAEALDRGDTAAYAAIQT